MAEQNIETEIVPSKKQRGYKADEGAKSFPSQKASYTPSSNINELSYGKSGGKANAQGGSIPSVEANGSVVGALPAMPGILKIGEDKNVSTPVSGS